MFPAQHVSLFLFFSLMFISSNILAVFVPPESPNALKVPIPRAGPASLLSSSKLSAAPSLLHSTTDQAWLVAERRDSSVRLCHYLTPPDFLAFGCGNAEPKLKGCDSSWLLLGSFCSRGGFLYSKFVAVTGQRYTCTIPGNWLPDRSGAFLWHFSPAISSAVVLRCAWLLPSKPHTAVLVRVAPTAGFKPETFGLKAEIFIAFEKQTASVAADSRSAFFFFFFFFPTFSIPKYLLRALHTVIERHRSHASCRSPWPRSPGRLIKADSHKESHNYDHIHIWIEFLTPHVISPQHRCLHLRQPPGFFYSSCKEKESPGASVISSELRHFQ